VRGSLLPCGWRTGQLSGSADSPRRSWVCTFALNLPWLPWLLYLDYGTPIFQCGPLAQPNSPTTHRPPRGVVPVWWLYLQTANFTFWNVLAVTAADDYFTHDCVDALRRLGVPHDRRSPAYKAACGWWPRELVPRTVKVTAAATALFGGLPLLLFLATPPYHKEHCSKLGFVAWVTLWSSAVGATLCTLVQVRAAGEGTSSPVFFRTDTRLCFQPMVFRLAWVVSGAEAELQALTRPSSLPQLHGGLERGDSEERAPGSTLYADLLSP